MYDMLVCCSIVLVLFELSNEMCMLSFNKTSNAHDICLMNSYIGA